MLDGTADHADPAARLRHARTHNWMHPLVEVVGALADAGFVLDRLREHPRVTWRMFRGLVRDGDGLFTRPDRPWSPLA